MRLHDEEQLNVKGNQSMGHVPAQNIAAYLPETLKVEVTTKANELTER
jgi:hypothetical protein